MLGYADPALLQIVLPDPTPRQLSPDRGAQVGRADSRGILVHFSPLSPGPQSSSEPPTVPCNCHSAEGHRILNLANYGYLVFYNQ